MAQSVVGICNSALLKLGSETISSLSEDNKRAIACNAQWEKIRDEVLSDHPWNFALKRASLASASEIAGWGDLTEFPLPSDCLRVLDTDTPEQDWSIEGRRLLTSYDSANIRYIAQITDPTYYSAKFCEAAALRLAADLAYSLVQSLPLQQAMLQAYAQFLADAKAADAQEGSPVDFTVDDWSIARL